MKIIALTEKELEEIKWLLIATDNYISNYLYDRTALYLHERIKKVIEKIDTLLR